MDLIGLPDGRPGEHAGISHTLKHYLAIAEVWEDLVSEDIQPRPWSILDTLDHLEPHPSSQWRDPGPEIRHRWSDLSNAHRAGYLAVISRVAASLPPLESWRPLERGVFITSNDQGLVFIVKQTTRGIALKTAFRSLGMTQKHHRSVPLDARNRDLRAVLARQKAATVVRTTTPRSAR